MQVHKIKFKNYKAKCNYTIQGANTMAKYDTAMATLDYIHYKWLPWTYGHT